MMALAQSNNQLAVNLHRLLSEEKGNVFFSPFSISTAMAMVYCAAEGETEAEMKEVLGYDDSGLSKDGVISAFQEQITDFVKATDSYTLHCANSILIDKKFCVKEEYKRIITESFKALLEELDFQSNSESVIKQINGWVKEKTNGMITELIQDLQPDAVMTLLNAVYFKGSWLHKFSEESTHKSTFYNDGKKENAKSVQMMNISESFKYIRNDTYEALELPYGGEEIAMLILLPSKMDGLESLEKTLAPSFVSDLVGHMYKGFVIDVSLPRFSLQYSKSLKSHFQQLGIHRLFKEGADLRDASDSKALAVSQIMHKAVLDVNEKGSEAAAATSVECVFLCMPRKFTVDHPFLFVIYDTKSEIILFMGRVEEL